MATTKASALTELSLTELEGKLTEAREEQFRLLREEAKVL